MSEFVERLRSEENHIDQKGSYPLHVVMTDEMNPREFALYDEDLFDSNLTD